MKRVFDLFFSVIGLLILAPLFLVFIILVVLDGKGGPFFFQTRVGKNGHDFKLIKFRSMRPGSEKSGQLTIGSRDSRITRVGYFLRKFKLDELPQLINVLKGDMSFVGPRPEVRKYVELYTKDQLRVLSVKPGITDYASIKYFNESDELAASDNPERTYIEVVMPEKLRINLEYVENHSVSTDFKIIFKTIFKLFSK